MERAGYVQILEKLDHATFDAALIQTWRPDYRWIRSHFTGVPFIFEDFRRYTQKRLTDFLSADPAMRGQKLTEDRDVLRYIAFETMFHSTQRIHMRQMDLKATCERLRSDFLQCLKSDTLVTAHPRSPLWEKGTGQMINGAQCYAQPLNSKHDRSLLTHITGKNLSDMCSFLEQAIGPQMTSLDRGEIEVYEEDFRAQMRELLMDQKAMYPELQEKIRHLTINTWLERVGENLEEKLADVSALLNAESSDDSGTNVLTDELSALPRVLHSMQKLTEQEPTPENRGAILRRLPGLEYMALLAAQESDIEKLMAIQSLLRVIENTVGIKCGDHPTLAFVDFAIASHCTHVQQNKILQPIDFISAL